MLTTGSMTAKAKDADVTAVPFNDLKRRYAETRDLILADLAAIIDGGVLIGGAAVASFEEALAAWCGVKHAIGMANGTDALELALRAAGVDRGDEVICVANAGGYATTALVAIGARPVYVDIDEATLQMDVARLGEALSASSRAVIVTHLYGQMNDVDAVRAELARQGRSDVTVIEDCAQAHGAARGGKRAGSLGDLSAFSFYPTKNLGALGDGGGVVTNDDRLAASLRQLRQYGWSSKYHSDRIGGRNSRLDPFQAVALQRELTRVDAANRRRREIWARYSQGMPQGWRLIGANDDSFVAHLGVIVAPDAAAQTAMRAALERARIGVDVHYPVLDCDQPAWRGVGRVVGDLSVSRGLSGRLLSVPLFPELTEDEQARVIKAIRYGD